MPSRPAIVVLGEGGACSGSIVADSVLLPSARRDGRIKVVCATIAFGMGGPPNHTALAPFTPLHPPSPVCDGGLAIMLRTLLTFSSVGREERQ